MSRSWTRPLATFGALVLGLGLLGLCVGALVAPGPSAQGYGVGAVPGAEVWVRAAGVRDGALGVAVLLVLWRHRAALRWVVGASLLVPVADVVLALSQGSGPLGAAPHLVGVVGVVALLLLCLAER